jgi:hypothetical protein
MTCRYSRGTTVILYLQARYCNCEDQWFDESQFETYRCLEGTWLAIVPMAEGPRKILRVS